MPARVNYTQNLSEENEYSGKHMDVKSGIPANQSPRFGAVFSLSGLKPILHDRKKAWPALRKMMGKLDNLAMKH